jgi:hypothetical protein
MDHCEDAEAGGGGWGGQLPNGERTSLLRWGAPAWGRPDQGWLKLSSRCQRGPSPWPGILAGPYCLC